MKKISFVIPLYNEEKNTPLVFNELTSVIKDLKYNYEIVLVNDGSRDNTWQEIIKLSKMNTRVIGLNLSRNFGHPSALQAGLEATTGDAVIMLDGDLQHPPTLIPRLVEKWEEGFDIVNTIRKSTEKISVFKKITAKLFYKLINTISDLTLNEGEADFRLLSRDALDVINKMPESPKFYRGLVNWIGFTVARVEYKAGARKHGTSSFTVKKMVELARLGFTSFSMKPLKIIIAIGVFLSSFSALALAIMLYVKLFINFQYFSNNVVLLTFLIFITGLLSTFQGIIAIYLVDIFNAAKGRPSYIVSKRVN